MLIYLFTYTHVSQNYSSACSFSSHHFPPPKKKQACNARRTCKPPPMSQSLSSLLLASPSKILNPCHLSGLWFHRYPGYPYPWAHGRGISETQSSMTPSQVSKSPKCLVEGNFTSLISNNLCQQPVTFLWSTLPSPPIN